MKKISRLMALLLVLVMLLSITASATEGISQDDLDASTYKAMVSDVQTYGLVDKAYQHYVDELAEMDVAQRYETLCSWHEGQLGKTFYKSFIKYYEKTYPGGDMICICESPLPYGDKAHGDGCHWKPVEGATRVDEETGVSVTGSIPSGVQLDVEPATLADVAQYAPELEGIANPHIVYDISMLQGTGEWQPAEGETVSVTMDVSELGEDGDDMLVYHVHQNEDGTAETQVLGPFKMNADGNITFMMNGFSYVLVLNSTQRIENVAVFYRAMEASGKYPVSTNGHFTVLGIYYDSVVVDGEQKQGDLHVLVGTDSGESQALGKFGSIIIDGADGVSITVSNNGSGYDVYDGSVTKITDENGSVLADSISGVSSVFDFNLGTYSIGGQFKVDIDAKAGGWKVDGLSVPLKLDYEIIKTVAEGTSASGTFGESVTVDRGDWVIFRINVNNKGERALEDMFVQDILPSDVFDMSTVQMSIDGENGEIGNWQPFDQVLFNKYDSEGNFSRLLYVMAQVKTDLKITSDTTYTNKATIDGMNMPTYEDTASIVVKAPTVGTLTVKKAVTVENPNDAIDPNKQFAFTVTDANGKVTTFNLTHNGTKELPNFPKGSYTVTETPVDGYATIISGPSDGTVNGTAYTGTMVGDGAPVVAFENKLGMKVSSLKVSKAVVGIDAPKTDKFTFTVEFTGVELPAGGYSYTKSPANADINVNWTINADATKLTGVVELQAEQNIEFMNLPTNIHYTVTETAKAGYEVDAPSKSGTIEAGVQSVAAFTNTYKYGSLNISKTVTDVPEGNDEINTEFTFTVTLPDTPVNGEHDGVKFINGVANATSVKFTNGVANVTLKHGESIKISGLPAGAGYTVTETLNSKYETTFTGADGKISNTVTAEAAFINKLKVGTLVINKTVNKSDFAGGTFTFQVTNDTYNYTQEYDITIADGTTSGSVTIPDLIAGTYNVRETTTNGYSTTMTVGSSTVNAASIDAKVLAGGTQTVNVVNTASEVMDLTVAKVWKDNNNQWNLRPDSVSIQLNGKVNNETFAHGKADLSLTAGGSWTGTWTGVPKYDSNGNLITYTVTEADVLKYTSAVTDNEGPDFEVTNTLRTYDLTIQKTGLDLTIDPASSTMYQVKGETGIAVDMTVAVHGNGSVTIKDLPVGNYTVTELTDWSWRYTADAVSKTVDVDGKNDSVTFTNTREKTKWLDSDCYAENRFTGSGAAATIDPIK